MNGVTTTFTMDLNTGLTQALSDGTNHYVYGLGCIAQVNTGTEYFLGDALRSVRLLADSSGAITYARAYDPYGVVTSTAGTSSTIYGYTGEVSGDSTELTYLRSRYYASGTGRFLTRDSFEGNFNTPASQNRFNYAHSNPVMNTDPSGHCIFAGIDTVICAALGGAILGGAVGGTFAHYYSGYIWDIANEGKCGCEGQMLVLAYSRQQFQNRAKTVGVALGALFGGIPGFGDEAAFSMALTGIGISGYGLQQSYERVVADPSNKCAQLDLAVSLIGLGASAYSALASYTKLAGGAPMGVGFRPGYSGPSQGWHNLKPSDLQPGHNGIPLQEAIINGTYRPPSTMFFGRPILRNTAQFIYVIDENGVIWVNRTSNGFHHPDLVNGSNVYGAGEMFINQQGQIVSITNISGHYLPQGINFFGYLR